MSMRRGSRFVSAARARGQAAIVILLLLLGVGATLLVYNFPTAVKLSIEKDKRTEEALALAKVALIGYAASVDVSGAGRPGDLPCPDQDDSGTADAVPACAGALALGRLPWKTLGLPDLRDGDGERLWYAVSSNFKNNPRTACAAPGDAGCLNSDTRGTITVRNSAGAVIYDGTNPDAYTPSGVIAVIFSPGAVLQRQDAASAQDRSCTGAGASCTAAGVCNSSPLTNTPKCNVVNYLDILTGVEDNANFTDSSNADGFINGVIRDTAGNLVVNDRLLAITYEDLMPVLQRRVAQEVMNCLTTYASTAQNNGRYPWAAPVTDVTSPYGDQANTLFGRVPDGPLSATFLGIGGAVSTFVCQTLGLTGLCMQSAWPAGCGITQGTWWNNWKEMVFYGVADAYKPANPVSALLGVPAPGGCGACLTVNPPSAAADKRVVVVVAGKRLSVAAYPAGNNQPRTTAANKQDPTNYLEGSNDNGPTDSTFEQQSISSSFSDFLLYQ